MGTFAAALIALALSGWASAADVALDIGHTVAEPGVITERGVTEFELNRSLALDLQAALVSAGVSVRLINESGDSASLTQRTALAAGDRLFISVHHDSTQARFRPVSHPRFRGYSLWVSDARPNRRTSVRCAAAIADELQAAYFMPSHYHADPVFGESRAVMDWRRGIFANRRLAVLRTAPGPALLFEAGVVAHPDEEAWLAQPETRSLLVQAAVNGIRTCLATLVSAEKAHQGSVRR